ncbi:MAG: helix-turn-helix domain-containing protein [Clostridiales bacterium]|jgi:transcriptional regulator with XRE-family HTH domain|nr:helix-turn-helix domain-containing protein [Clostridiales bacterium]
MRNRFPEKLKELRLERNLGQIELSKAISVSKGIISLWENGLREPTLSSLLALAEYFNISLDDLVGYKDY